MHPIFWKRNFSALLSTLPLEYKVGPYAKSVFGGPKRAEIYAKGKELDLWELMEYLRCPVIIYSDKGDENWWGFVAEVQANIGNWSIGVNIDSMANYIGVAYQDEADGGQPKKTAWTQDAASVAEYGRKELLLSSSGSNATHALAARDKYLAEKKLPIPVITERQDRGGPDSATLLCRGWFDTLTWRYAPIPVKLSYSYENIGTLEYAWGDNNAKEVAQSIWFSGDCNLASISIYVKKVGTPADNVKVSLCEFNDGITPGDELTSGTIDGALLTTSYTWVNIPVSEYLFEDFNSYFIKLTRSGGQDADNYYKLTLDNLVKYPLGQFNVLIGSNWAAGPDADMPFRLYSDDIIETTQQVSTLVANHGQFIGGISIESQSGLYTASARDGNATAYYEVDELLKMGTVNYRRLLAEVSAGRKMRVYEEPTVPQLANQIMKSGMLKDPYDTEIRKESCPVGMWARLKDVVPGSVDTSKLADPTLMFIDACEYNPATDKINLTPRGFVDPFKIGRPKDG